MQYSVSGHGGQIPDLDGDEADGLDEGTRLRWTHPDTAQLLRCSDYLRGRRTHCRRCEPPESTDQGILNLF